MKVYKKQILKDYTSFKIGGMADILVEPKDKDELLELIKFLKASNIIYYILGNGTNVLISDKGVRGCVVHIGNSMSSIKVNGTKIEVEAGALMKDVAKVALNNALTGFEELSGIPGSIGGAIAMNAGAYEKEIKDLVSSVYVINENNNLVELKKDLLNFEYRKSAISEKNLVVVSVVLNLQEGERKDIEEKMERFEKLRTSKQPMDVPSAGSTFKRPEGYYASLLISESNLMGESVGGAMVSEKHAGFIVNYDNATSADVYKLMNKVIDTVKMYHNVTLEPEIRLWGKFKK